MRQIFADIGERVDNVLAIALNGHVKISGALRGKPRADRQHLLRDLESDLAPVIDRPDAVVFVRLIRRAIEQLEAQIFGAGFLQQALGFRARLLDVRPIAGDLLELLLARRQRRAGKGDAADRADQRDLRQFRGGAPTIERQRQGTAHAGVVERLALVVRRDQPRNSIAARSLRIASTRVACLSAKIPLKPSR